ncbi:MAG: hypothetical protein E7233_05870 [Lachnospiraceae bacterium]|nr:hypothetical protein [Lachnospiraceae bacterium]
MKKVLSLILTGALVCFLMACSGTQKTAETTVPAETKAETEQESLTEEATEEDSSASSLVGSYHFDCVDIYGDVTGFTVTIKEDGSFNIMTLGAMGNGVYSGDSWTENGADSFTTGTTDNRIETDWTDDDGSVTWIIEGDSVKPEGYTEPTEFQAKAEFTDPVIGAEAVGVYTFGSVNNHGSTVPYILWVNGDGTYKIHMNNSFTGIHTYSGTEWTIDSDSVIHFGPASFEGDEPMGTWFDGENGWVSSWHLHGDGTCDPEGYDGQTVDVDLAAQPVEIYPAGAEYVGIYRFGSVNDHGSTVPYFVWLNADGSAVIHMNNSFTGLHTYTAKEWKDEGDGLISIGALSYEGDEPMGGWFTEGTFESVWQVNADGTCVPEGYTGSVAEIDLAAQPEEIYPVFSAE